MEEEVGRFLLRSLMGGGGGGRRRGDGEEGDSARVQLTFEVVEGDAVAGVGAVIGEKEMARGN
jgi:hypothetical protein